MYINWTVNTLMAHCMQINSTVCIKSAPQMNSISAQIAPCTHEKSNSSLTVLSASSKYMFYVRLLKARVFPTLLFHVYFTEW